MHPPLDKPHPYCKEAIAVFKRCHEENKLSKWWGACNDAKAALDMCLRKQKGILQRQNLERSKRERERMERVRG